MTEPNIQTATGTAPTGCRCGAAAESAPVTPPLLIDAREAARLCGMRRTAWFNLNGAGRVPRGVKLGRRRLWNRGELVRWVEAGCPPRDRWESMKSVRGAE